jgi:hypothetical protein
MDPLTYIPEKHRQGDTLSIALSITNYSAASYAGKLHLKGNSSQKSFDATASGEAFAVTITSADSNELQPGRYQYGLVVTASGESSTILTGSIEIEPSLASEDISGFDPRSHAQIMVDELEDTLEKIAKYGVAQSVSLGKSVTYADIGTLQNLLKEKRYEVAKEQHGAIRTIDVRL